MIPKTAHSIFLFIFVRSALSQLMKECDPIDSQEAEGLLGKNAARIPAKVRNPNYTEDRDFLNEGSFGKVFQINNAGRSMALKAIKRGRISKFEGENIDRELTLWPDLSIKIPDAVPTFYGCFFDKGYLYIFQERLFVDLENEDFQENFKRKNLDDRLVLMISITDALANLHHMKMVHNDFKLSNMMFVDSKYTMVKLIDFGFATKRATKFRAGTPVYNSPEKINDYHVKANPAIDIWALGVVFFELLGNFDDDSIFLEDKYYNDGKFTEAAYVQFMANFDALMKNMWGYNPGKKKFTGSVKEVPNVFELVKLVLDRNPSRRPTAIQILDALETLLEDEMENASAGSRTKLNTRSRTTSRGRAGRLEALAQESDEDMSSEFDGDDGFDVMDSQMMAYEPQKYERRYPMVLRKRRGLRNRLHLNI